MCLLIGIGLSCGPSRLRASNIIIIILTKLVACLFLCSVIRICICEILVQSSGQSSSDGCQIALCSRMVNVYM